MVLLDAFYEHQINRYLPFPYSNMNENSENENIFDNERLDLRKSINSIAAARGRAQQRVARSDICPPGGAATLRGDGETAANTGRARLHCFTGQTIPNIST